MKNDNQLLTLPHASSKSWPAIHSALDVGCKVSSIDDVSRIAQTLFEISVLD